MSNTGVNCGVGIRKSAYMMLATCLAYAIIQGSALAANCAFTSGNDECGQTDPTTGALVGNGKDEKTFAFLGLAYCVIGFCGYIAYNLMEGETEGQHVRRLQKLLKQGDLSIEVCFGEILSQKSEGFMAPQVHYHEEGYEGEHLTALTVQNSTLTAGKFSLSKMNTSRWP